MTEEKWSSCWSTPTFYVYAWLQHHVPAAVDVGADGHAEIDLAEGREVLHPLRLDAERGAGLLEALAQLAARGDGGGHAVQRPGALAAPWAGICPALSDEVRPARDESRDGVVAGDCLGHGVARQQQRKSHQHHPQTVLGFLPFHWFGFFLLLTIDRHHKKYSSSSVADERRTGMASYL